MRCALTVAVALVAASPISAAEPIAPSASYKLAGTADPMTELSLQSLSATRERPLFSPTRRPPPTVLPPSIPETGSLAATPEPPPFELLGAVLGEKVSYILIRNRNTHEVRRLSPTEEADGWKVAAVTARSVVLEHDGRVEKLMLGDAPEPNAPSTPQPTGIATALTTADPIARAASPVSAEYERLMKKLNLH